MKKIGILALLAGCGAVALAGVIYFKSTPALKNSSYHKTNEEADLRQTELLLSQNKVDDALKIIHDYEGQINIGTELGRKWYILLVDAYMQSAKIEKLVVIYENFPWAFQDNEKAAVAVAYGYILSKKPQDYQKIRDDWKDKATLTETWIVLDSDSKVLEGKKEEALKILKANKFEGKKDVDRLTRLALLYVIEDPKMALETLSQAAILDPQNPDIMSSQAKLLESLGKDSLALYEYIAAVQAAPNNLFLRDQLAEYYMRHNQVGLALSIWLEMLSRPTLDFIWIKALFWSKMVTPVSFDWTKASPPTGTDKAFIEYLIALPQNVYWDETTFNQLPNAKKFLKNLQITFWLRLLEALKKGDEKRADALLKFNNFSENTLNPQLERALKQVINYRLTGSFDLEVSALNGSDKEVPFDQSNAFSKNNQTFFDQLNTFSQETREGNTEQKLPQDIHDLLMSKEAFSALFLAAGWLEAALELHEMPVIPDNFPEWVPYGITQALRINRSPAEALIFATQQKKTTALSVLIGEIYFADKKSDEALTVLEPYVKDPSDAGYRSSWIVSLIYTEKKEYDKAKNTIEAQPKLADDPLGKEGLARIALLQNNVELADRLYSQLQNQSPEAMSYLARKAYLDKDWLRAQELTQKLLLMFPDNSTLRENLNKIVEEQKAEQAAAK